MSTFARIAGFALLMLSLSYFVSAFPTPDINVKIPAIIGTDPVSCILAKLIVEIEAKTHALRMSIYSLASTGCLTHVLCSWLYLDRGAGRRG